MFLSQLQHIFHYDLALSEPKLAKVVDYGAKYNYGWGPGHASKVTQLALKLWHDLASELNLQENTITPLAITGTLHDIGRKVDDGSRHHEKSYKAILTTFRGGIEASSTTSTTPQNKNR